MRKVLLVFLLLILGLCAASPYFIGYQIKKSLYEVAAGFSQDNKNFIVAIQDYQGGWLSSDATIEIRFQVPAAMSSSTPGAELKTVTETIHSHILHGPLVQEPLSGRFILALAIIQSKAFISGFDYTSSASDHSVTDMTTWVDFKNHWHSQYTQPSLAFTLGQVAQIHWQTATGSFDFTLNNNQLAAYRFNIASKEMVVGLPSSTTLSEVNMDALQYENEFSKTSTGIWAGTAKMTLPILTIKKKDQTQITLQDSQFENTISNPNTNFYDFALHIAVKNIQTAAAVLPSLGPVQFNFSANHLNLAGVQALGDFFKAMHHQPLTDEERKTYFSLLPKLLTTTTLLNENLDAATPDGKLLNEAHFSWQSTPVLPTNPQEMVQNANTVITLRVATALVDKLIAAHDGPATTTTPAATTSAANTATTATTPASPGTSATNSTPANAATPDTTTTATTPTPPQTEQQAPPTFKSTLDAWLEKGYVVKEGNDYVVLLKRENGVTTINGKTPTP